MPVTAKLSKEFYDRLGERVADERVNWFNEVDATYRADLRSLNEQNFTRFDYKLEQRTAELYAKLDAKIDRTALALDAKIDRLRVEVISAVDAKLDALRAELIKWSFLFWIGTVVTIVGAIRAMRQVLALHP